SRRRHTRFSRDWSSDVCSSDLLVKNTGLHRREKSPPALQSTGVHRYQPRARLPISLRRKLGYAPKHLQTIDEVQQYAGLSFKLLPQCLQHRHQLPRLLTAMITGNQAPVCTDIHPRIQRQARLIHPDNLPPQPALALQDRKTNGRLTRWQGTGDTGQGTASPAGDTYCVEGIAQAGGNSPAHRSCSPRPVKVGTTFGNQQKIAAALL